ncbi:hypothetical protein GBA52_004673 [Prunus armeniaca]|nr:hypothetical protein GBA52_004673 [Prunus armeniaca]
MDVFSAGTSKHLLNKDVIKAQIAKPNNESATCRWLIKDRQSLKQQKTTCEMNELKNRKISSQNTQIEFRME